jgi:hypothetical protein
MKIRPVGAELLHADGWTDKTKLIVAFRNFSKAPKKWGFSDCALMNQRAARRCQFCVMSNGLAHSSRPLETRAVYERCSDRASVDGMCSRAEYKIQRKRFEFGTAYISFRMETRLWAGRLDTQNSIPPRAWLWDLSFLTVLSLRMLIFRDVALCRWVSGSWGFEEPQCLQLQQSSCHGRMEEFLNIPFRAFSYN